MVPAVPRRAYECVGWCETQHGSSNGQAYCHLRLRAPGPRPLQSRPGAQWLPLFFTLKRTLEGRRFTTNEDVEAAVRTQDTDFYKRGFFKLVNCGTNASVSVGTTLKNSRLPLTSVCISSMQFRANGGLGKRIFWLSLVFSAAQEMPMSWRYIGDMSDSSFVRFPPLMLSGRLNCSSFPWYEIDTIYGAHGRNIIFFLMNLYAKIEFGEAGRIILK
jgi:hypothetical protein